MITPWYRGRRGQGAGRIDELGERLRIDSDGVDAILGPCPPAAATCFAGIERYWDPFGSGSESRRDGPDELAAALRAGIERAVEGAHRPVVALSGGIDSLLIAGVLGDVLGRPPAAATLVTGLDGYCEAETTVRTAERLGLELAVVEASAEELIDALPAAVAAAEVPLYNLHPVTKWVFAQRVAALGYDRILTGDAADQLAAHDPGTDYLPVVAAMFTASGVDVMWPFTDDDVVGVLAAAPPDPTKRALRALAMAYGDTELAVAPKRPRLVPPLELPSSSAVTRDGDDGSGVKADAAWTRAVTLDLLIRSHC